MVPHSTDLREEILREFHCSRFSVHPSGTKMYQDLHRQYYWSGMKRHVADFVRQCLTCQQVGDPMVADHWFMQIEKVLEAMEITSDATRIRLAAFQLEGES